MWPWRFNSHITRTIGLGFPICQMKPLDLMRSKILSRILHSVYTCLPPPRSTFFPSCSWGFFGNLNKGIDKQAVEKEKKLKKTIVKLECNSTGENSPMHPSLTPASQLWTSGQGQQSLPNPALVLTPQPSSLLSLCPGASWLPSFSGIWGLGFEHWNVLLGILSKLPVCLTTWSCQIICQTPQSPSGVRHRQT